MKPLLADDNNHSRIMQVKAKLKVKTVNAALGQVLDKYEGKQ